MELTTSQFTNAAIHCDSSVLEDIHMVSKNIAVYQRDIRFLDTELAGLAGQDIEFQVSGSIESIHAKLDTYFLGLGTPSPLLTDDVIQLLRLFAGTTRISSFRVLLVTVRSDMCRKFHADRNDLRLLCTYIGPGTIWLPEEAIEDKGLHAWDTGLEIDQRLAQQTTTGDVTILKGNLYPGASPVLHRSPVIESHGETRLLLRVDTNEPFNLNALYISQIRAGSTART
jgi:hypothetical protein